MTRFGNHSRDEVVSKSGHVLTPSFSILRGDVNDNDVHTSLHSLDEAVSWYRTPAESPADFVRLLTLGCSALSA